jgi:hypothetical protein
VGALREYEEHRQSPRKRTPNYHGPRFDQVVLTFVDTSFTFFVRRGDGARASKALQRLCDCYDACMCKATKPKPKKKGDKR